MKKFIYKEKKPMLCAAFFQKYLFSKPIRYWNDIWQQFSIYYKIEVCRLFGHNYKLLRKISPTIREVKCGRCKQEFGMNDSVQALLPLDDELRDCHANILLAAFFCQPIT
jgi:hypothetical protein